MVNAVLNVAAQLSVLSSATDGLLFDRVACLGGGAADVGLYRAHVVVAEGLLDLVAVR